MERSIERLFLFVKMDYASKQDDFVPCQMNFSAVKNSDSAYSKIFLDFMENICNYPKIVVVSIRTVIIIYGFWGWGYSCISLSRSFSSYSA